MADSNRNCQNDAGTVSLGTERGIQVYVNFSPDLLLSEQTAEAMREAVRITSQRIASKLDAEFRIGERLSTHAGTD